MDPDWKKFEEAVAAFLQSLEPNAKVEHNVSRPDLDTGLPRQRDVWISTTFGGHIPITIFVSCKREKKKLDQQDIDAFLGELRSSGAHVGVIYSYSGYTEPAIAKAKACRINCCSLYENAPPDVPELLTFSAFCHTEMYRLWFGGLPGTKLQTMNDLFDLQIEVDGVQKGILTHLVSEYDTRASAMMGATWNKPTQLADPRWQADAVFTHPDLQGVVGLRLTNAWRRYEAKMESWVINGSYSFTSNDFKGTIATPVVDRLGPHPGPGWELVKEGEELPGKNLFSFYLHGGDLEKEVRDVWGSAPLAETFTKAASLVVPQDPS